MEKSSAGSASSALNVVVAIAQEFSPRFERHRDDLVAVDVSGLTRLLGPAQTIGAEMRREAAARGVRVHVAIAGTRMAALLLAQARPGLTLVAPGDEPAALAPLAIGILEKIEHNDDGTQNSRNTQEALDQKHSAGSAISAFKRWGLKTLGELASLPTADLVSRLGRQALAWQAAARGEDLRPLVPMLEEERFEASLDLEWPIVDLEPLSFVLTRLLEPLSTRLERRDRGAAVLHVLLHLVTKDTCARRLQLPTPMRDVRALRTLALLDLEARPAAAAIDRVTIVIDPTPGRIVQHTLYTRAQPTPEQLSTLLARLGALMGQDRFGAPAAVDSDRPGAFAMAPFTIEHDRKNRGDRKDRKDDLSQGMASAIDHVPSAISHQPLTSALRRCREPVPARVAIVDGRPVRVTTDRRGFAGGAGTHCAGPWRTSGAWWAEGTGRSDKAGRPGGEVSVSSTHQPHPSHQTHLSPWNRDEWDLALSDGAVYRVFRDRDVNRWFIDAVVD